jgi:hypothetical protein
LNKSKLTSYRPTGELREGTAHATLTQFNKTRERMRHVSAPIIDNPRKAALAVEIDQINGLAAQYLKDNNHKAFDVVSFELRQLRAQYAAMPDRLVGSGRTYNAGRNAAKRDRRMMHALFGSQRT